MGKWIAGVGLLMALSACSCGPSDSKNAGPDGITKVAAKTGPPADPDQALFEQVRSGTYQINAAMDAIEETRKTAKEIAGHELGPTQGALLQVAKDLDEAGGTLSDYSDDPPPFEKFKADFKAQDERRLKAIDAANDALNSLSDAQDLLGKLLDSKPPEPAKSQLEDAASALDGCISAVEDAIKTMGGKVEDEPPAKK